MGKKDRLNLMKISSKLVGKKFAAGFDKYKAGKGLDCFSLIIEYFRLRGKEITGEEKHFGYKVKDYLRIYDESQVKAIGLATSLLGTFMEKINKEFSNPGDVLVLKNKKIKFDIIHFGIETANSKVIVAVNQKGVEVIEKKYFEVLGAYRWAQK